MKLNLRATVEGYRRNGYYTIAYLFDPEYKVNDIRAEDWDEIEKWIKIQSWRLKLFYTWMKYKEFTKVFEVNSLEQ